MSTSNPIIKVADIPVQVVRKDIKNLHLGVYPPKGSVRISVPRHITDDNVRLAIVSKLKWIKKRQEEFRKQPRQSERECVSGESHYFQGKRYTLNVVQRHGKHTLSIKNNARMLLQVKPGTTKENRLLVVDDWYRQHLKTVIPELLKKWQPIVGVEVKSWGVKQMRTKWGSCNIADRRIWINLELAKKPPEFLEYILVHELVHLIERKHNDNFRNLMDKLLPKWRYYRDELNSLPVRHEDWAY